MSALNPNSTPPEISLPPIERVPALINLLAIIARLRDPAGGCPWDLQQTHASLKPYLLEESYECLEAIDSGDPALLCEELGDVLLQVVLHAQLAREAGQFDFEAICRVLGEKIVRRHPHVFGETVVSGADEVNRNWERIKQAEKGDRPQPQSILEGISKSQSALSRALQTSKRAVKAGFAWPSTESLWACVMSELEEFREATQTGGAHDRLEDEMGDIFFAAVSLAHHYQLDPETALTRAIAKFTRRFQTMERLAAQPLETLDFAAWDALWNQAKAVEI